MNLPKANNRRYVVERHEITTEENESQMADADARSIYETFNDALNEALKLAQKQYDANEVMVNSNTYPDCIEFFEPGQPGCVRLRPAEKTVEYTVFDL